MLKVGVAHLAFKGLKSGFGASWSLQSQTGPPQELLQYNLVY